MNNNHNIRIIMRPLQDRPGEYVATYTSEFLQAEFSVILKDSLFGALALQAFGEMVRKAFGKLYRTGEIDYAVSEQAVPLHSRALLDLTEPHHACCA